MAEIRASELTPKMRIREYGSLDDEEVTVAKVVFHGDTVLITDTEGEEMTLDRDEVVELLPPRSLDAQPLSRLIMLEQISMTWPDQLAGKRGFVVNRPNDEIANIKLDTGEEIVLHVDNFTTFGSKPVSSCCHAEVERTADYTDTHVYVVEDAYTDEDGKIVSARYYATKTYDGTDGENVSINCSACGQEIEDDDIEWDES